jgi:hypothetical protein
MPSLICGGTDEGGKQGHCDGEGELPNPPGIGGDQLNSPTAPSGSPGRLCRQGLEIDQQYFQQGYVAGWQSVRGADDQPVLIPPSPVLVGRAMYMVGFSRGARDAGAMIA